MSDALLLELVRDRDLPCPACGHNVRGVAAPRCPECGAPLELRVASPDLRLGPWLSTLLALVLPLGFSAAGVIAWSSIWLQPGRSLSRSAIPAFIAFALGVVVLGPLTFLAIRRRRRFWLLRRETQVQFMLGGFGIGAAVVLALFVVNLVRTL